MFADFEPMCTSDTSYGTATSLTENLPFPSVTNGGLPETTTGAPAMGFFQ